MKTLTFTIAGNTFYNPNIVIYNQILKHKKGKYGTKVYTIETDKNELDIEIYTWYELESKYWLPVSLFFFIISCFGIFDIKQKNFFKSLKYKGKIKLTEETNQHLKLTFTTIRESQKAFFSEGNCTIEDNESNQYFFNQELQNRSKLLKKIKRFTWIGLIILIIIIFIMKLF